MLGGKILDRITIQLRDRSTHELFSVYINVFDNSLSRKWLTSLNDLLRNNYHLEKNYCFFGFVNHKRNGWYILDQVNRSIKAINDAGLGYQIDDYFDMDNTLTSKATLHYDVNDSTTGRNIRQDKLNWLHRYFEDLQGVSGAPTEYYLRANATTRWHIRQLNLLCHEFESWALSYRKEIESPEWQRPSQLMCWLNAPRFTLDPEDYELFGIETINRPLGGVFVGVNKAVGKHHWEVYMDEGRDSRVDELVSTTMRSQTEAAGDFDIEWANNPGEHEWQKTRLKEFREWLIVNGFNPDDKTLTIGHPQVGQVDLLDTFLTNDYQEIWKRLNTHLDVYSVQTSDAYAVYDYCWSDQNYAQQQINIIGNNK
jgi:hypothetical protein